MLKNSKFTSRMAATPLPATLFAFRSSSSASYFNKPSIERQNKTFARASARPRAFPQMQLTVQWQSARGCMRSAPPQNSVFAQCAPNKLNPQRSRFAWICVCEPANANNSSGECGRSPLVSFVRPMFKANNYLRLAPHKVHTFSHQSTKHLIRAPN